MEYLTSNIIRQTDFDHVDPDEEFICPYDPVHKVIAKRFPYHVMKCRKVGSYSILTAIVKGPWGGGHSTFILINRCMTRRAEQRGFWVDHYQIGKLLNRKQNVAMLTEF